MAADVVVEDEFGVAVDVEGTLVSGEFGEAGAGSVDCGGGGVDQGNLAVEGEVQQLLGVGEVVVQHVAAIVFEGVGAGALMEDGSNSGVLEVASFESCAELALVHVVGVFCAGEVEELRAGEVRGGGEVVDQQDVALAYLIQLLDKVAADEACSAGNDDHFWVSSLTAGFAVSFFTMLVVEKPSTVGTISTRPPLAITSSCPTTVSTV